jgi:hypothetical protein
MNPSSEIRFTPLGKDSHGKSNLSEWRKNLKTYLSPKIGELADAILHIQNGTRVIHPDYTNIIAPDYTASTPASVKMQRDYEYTYHPTRRHGNRCC